MQLSKDIGVKVRKFKPSKKKAHPPKKTHPWGYRNAARKRMVK